MKTVTDATLYVVKGPRGPYYAIRENDTGAVITERTEHAAATLASAKDMIIVERREISHEKLLAMMTSQFDGSQSVSPADQLQWAAGEPGSSRAQSAGVVNFARKLVGSDSQQGQEESMIPPQG